MCHGSTRVASDKNYGTWVINSLKGIGQTQLHREVSLCVKFLDRKLRDVGVAHSSLSCNTEMMTLLNNGSDQNLFINSYILY